MRHDKICRAMRLSKSHLSDLPLSRIVASSWAGLTISAASCRAPEEYRTAAPQSLTLVPAMYGPKQSKVRLNVTCDGKTGMQVARTCMHEEALQHGGHVKFDRDNCSLKSMSSMPLSIRVGSLRQSIGFGRARHYCYYWGSRCDITGFCD